MEYVKAITSLLAFARREPFSRTFGTNETQQLREGQLVGRMLLQRLATGATGVKQARYRQGPTSGSGALVRACAVYTSYYGSLALAVQCEKCMVQCLHPVPAYEFSAEGYAL